MVKMEKRLSGGSSRLERAEALLSAYDAQIAGLTRKLSTGTTTIRGEDVHLTNRQRQRLEAQKRTLEPYRHSAATQIGRLRP